MLTPGAARVAARPGPRAAAEPGRPVAPRPTAPRPPARPAAARRPARTARRRCRGRLVARAVLVLLLTVLLGATTFVAGLLAAPFDERAVPPAPRSVLLLSDDGTQFASIRPPQRREVVRAQDIPDVMRKAIMAAEDARFLDHKGVDPIATVRAAYRDLAGGRRQGGSTITQQYVKNTYVGNDRTLLRKLREAAIAVRLESRRDKEDILTDYLNVLYLGNSVYGVQAAAKYYFGVDVKDLDLDEGRGRRDANLALARAAMLAGIAPAPSAWNPVKDFETAKVRQRYTLNQLVAADVITPTEASRAYGRGVTPVQETPPEVASDAPEFADAVTAQLRRQYAGEREDVLFRGGLRVTTTLDATLQEALSRALREVLPDDDDPQGAAVAIDIRNGDVKAMTTLRRVPPRVQRDGTVTERTAGYERGGFNLATNGWRQAGSTIKPFTLAVALEQGLDLDTRRPAPRCNSIPDPTAPGGVYAPCNSGEAGYRGSLTLREALAASVNTVYVPLALEVGRPRIKEVMEAAGIRTNPARTFSTLPNSFGLGATAEVSPLSLANAYGTLMNHGLSVPPRFVTEQRQGEDGPVVDRPEVVPVGRALPVDVADRVAEAMSDVTGPGGTARRAQQDFPVFGKTGTTNGSKDSWFVGCARSPQNLCIAVWMGYEFSECVGVQGRDCGEMRDVNGVPQVYGGTLPAQVFSRTFEVLRELQAEKAAAAAAAAGAAAPEQVRPAAAQTRVAPAVPE
jgi:penicillin-binding protein 1A